MAAARAIQYTKRRHPKEQTLFVRCFTVDWGSARGMRGSGCGGAQESRLSKYRLNARALQD